MCFSAVRNMIRNCLDKGNTSHNDKTRNFISVYIITSSKYQVADFRLYSQHMVHPSQMSDSLKSDGLPQSEINDERLSNAHALLDRMVPDSRLLCK